MKDKQLSIKVNGDQLDQLKEIFGLRGTYGEDSRAIQLAINFTINVILRLFGRDLRAMFIRDPKDPSRSKY